MNKVYFKSISLILLMSLFLVSCATYSFFGNTDPSVSTPPARFQSLDNPKLWRANPQIVWNNIQRIPLTKLEATNLPDSNQAGWIKLAIISKRFGNDSAQLTNQLMEWRKNNPSHPGNSLFPDNNTLLSLEKSLSPKHIVLLLPFQGHYGSEGKSIREGFLNAYYSSSNKNGTRVSFIDTSNTKQIQPQYQQALAEGADFIVGPLTKENVQELIHSDAMKSPTLALNYASTWLGSTPNNFYQFGLSPQDEANQVADKARQAGLSHAIIIAPDDDWGQRVAKTLASRWESQGGKVTDKLYFSTHTNFNQEIASLLRVDPKMDRQKMASHNNKTELAQQRRQDFDVVFLLAPPEKGRLIVPLLKYYYADNIPIYSTSAIYSGSPSPQKDNDLNGVIFPDVPWVLGLANHSNPTKQTNRLYAVGRDAFLISQNLPRLKALPNFPIYASTGAITLNDQNQIKRRLPWVKIHDGQPEF